MTRVLSCGAVFCTGFVLLTFELVSTRFLSASLGAGSISFIIVSLALLGMGGGGIVIYVLLQKKKPLDNIRVALGICFPLAILITLFLYISLGRIPSETTVTLGFSHSLIVWLVIGCAITVVAFPFFLGSMILALLLRARARDANIIYFLDLIGSALGCLATILFLNLFGGQILILFLTLVACVVSLLILPRNIAAPRSALMIIVVGTIILGMMHLRYGILAFGQERDPRPLLSAGWNSFSYVSVFGPVEGAQLGVHEWWHNEGRSEQSLPFLAIYIDQNALTPVIRFDGNWNDLSPLRWTLPALPAVLARGGDELVIGSGGGVDVLSALLLGAHAVTAVEVNPLIIDDVQNEYRNFSGGIYGYPQVTVHEDEGRNYIHNTSETFDAISLTLVDTWAASASGSYATSESYLYTKEAIRDYWQHLTTNGVLAIVRWEPEIGRLIRLIVSTISELETDNPYDHLALVQKGDVYSVLVKKKPLTRNDRLLLGSWVQKARMNLSLADELTRYASSWTPVPTDDRPFFLNAIGSVNVLRPGEDPQIAVRILIFAFWIIVAFITILCLLPCRPRRWKGLHAALPNTIYFFGIGFGFLVVEMVLVQKLILFLGRPIYSLSVVLFSLILSAGLGSLMGKYLPATRKMAALLFMVITTLLLLVLLISNSIFPRFAGLPISLRIALVIMIILPVGIVMGMALPFGIRLLPISARRTIPWLWGINGAASTLGAIAPLILGINVGLNVTFLSGVGGYLLAFLVTPYISNEIRTAQVSRPHSDKQFIDREN
jgi:hypothetical protein